MTYFTIIAVILFFTLCFVWSREGLHNMLIKTVLAGMAFWGVVIALIQLGYIVK